MKLKPADVSVERERSIGGDCETEFIPTLRSGAWADIGFRSTMEDVYICKETFMCDYGLKNFFEGPNAFYGVYILPSSQFVINVLHCNINFKKRTWVRC